MGVEQRSKERVVRYRTLAVDCVATDRLQIPAIKTQQAKYSTSNERYTGRMSSWPGEHQIRLLDSGGSVVCIVDFVHPGHKR